MWVLILNTQSVQDDDADDTTQPKVRRSADEGKTNKNNSAATN